MFPSMIGTVVIAGITGYLSERFRFTRNGVIPSVIICVGGAFLFYFIRIMFGLRFGSAGVDAIWVSNHAGRQFDGAPASLDQLPEVRAATTLPLIFDSGIEGGLDILRAIALGADFVMLGRAWHYAICALGAQGPTHLAEILRRDLIANIGQLGVARPTDLRGRTIAIDPA